MKRSVGLLCTGWFVGGIVLGVVAGYIPSPSASPLQTSVTHSAISPLMQTPAVGLHYIAQQKTDLPALSTRWLDRFGNDFAAELRCLALNIYWEARSEPHVGQFAIAAVTLNRVKSKAFPDTICGVVRQGGEKSKHRCQFSWWCDGKSDQPTDQRAWLAAQAVAYAALFLDLPDPTGGALWYHADYVDPYWSKVMRKAAMIGRHVFYGDSLSAGKTLADAGL